MTVGTAHPGNTLFTYVTFGPQMRPERFVSRAASVDARAAVH